jgi:predicted nucleotidyltransferase
MKRSQTINALLNATDSLGSIAHGTEWYLFGSVDRDEASPSDIDLLILCTDATQADALRQAIDPDLYGIPLHLSLMTFDEAAEVDAVHLQQASRILRESPAENRAELHSPR